MVSFLRYFSGFSNFNQGLFTLVSKASFVLLARNLSYYMAESLEVYMLLVKVTRVHMLNVDAKALCYCSSSSSRENFAVLNALQG